MELRAVRRGAARRPRPTAATATAARPASRPRGSRRARRSRSSTSPSRPRSAATRVLHLGQLDFLAGRENVVLLGPPGTGKTHLAIALGIRACLAGHRVAFRTATEWVALLADAQRQGRLDDELDRLQRIPLLIVDEVGYIPFDPHAANLMFMLVCRRYERASLIVTSNKPFSGLGRDLRRRRRRRRDDRPARPPRRDPRPQRRQLPPQRPRPRPPTRRQSPRNGLTDHLREPRQSPQDASTRPSSARLAPQDPETTLSEPPERARPGSRRPGVPKQDQEEGVTFQPAQVVHISTGLDSRYQAGTELSEPEVSEVAFRNLSARISYFAGVRVGPRCKSVGSAFAGSNPAPPLPQLVRYGSVDVVDRPRAPPAAG